jgi:hypothetical protein
MNWRDFLSTDFLKFFLPLFLPLAAGVVAWLVNENQRRRWEEYRRKEERYRELLKALQGFYATHDTARKQVFLEELSLCWLYCPDEVIGKAYAFLDTVKTGVRATDQEKEAAAGAFVAAVRRDLLGKRLVSKTNLQGSDFRFLRVQVPSSSSGGR